MTLFWLGLSWLVGIVAGKWIILDIWQWLALAGSSLGAGILLRRRRSLLLAFVIVAFFYSGAARYQISMGEIDAGHLARFNDCGCTVTLTGVITAPPDVHDYYVGLRIAVEKLRYSRDGASQSVHGLALIYAPRFGNYRYGDRVEAYGTLETPPVFETFSYREYLARQGIHSIMRNPSLSGLAAHQANPPLRLIYGSWPESFLEWSKASHQKSSKPSIKPEPRISLPFRDLTLLSSPGFSSRSLAVGWVLAAAQSRPA
jgi:competence protein ComEC